MSNPNAVNPVDITPEDNGLSPEEAEKFRAENQPRGHEALDDAEEYERLEARAKELEAELREMGYDLKEADAEEEEPTPAEVANTLYHSKGAKISLTHIAIAAATTLAVGGIIAGSIFMAGKYSSKSDKTPAPEPTAPVVESIIETEDVVDDIEDTVEKEEARGIVDGYGEEGMWLSEGKTGPYAFADFQKVVELHDGDVKEAIKDVASNQVESMADCISGMSDEIRPEGYQGLSMAEIDEKLENLSAEEYDLLREEFESIINKAEIKEVTLNGKYDNAYMGVKDGDSRIIGSKEANEKDVEVNHETMQLIKCTTNEKGSKAYELTWRDEKGNIIDSEMIKEACTQVVEKEGKNPTRFKGLPEATEKAITGGGPMTVIITGGGPTIVPDPEPEPEPTPTPPPKKWGKSGDPHTGDDYKQTIVDNPAVPDISNINDGNQGYVDDNQAAPGTPSEYNGVSEDNGFADSGIVAGGADNSGERLEGGEDQSDGNMAGENAYHDEESISAGEAADAGGNQAQEQAQQNNEVGGDNNSNAAEEAAVAEGNF
ncbi:hypothetical protein IKG07_02470 [Candidatus Saccharibacteria bacterium]|nr:hypothetical protein [Candidatus Saccharibacteria bacterium]